MSEIQREDMFRALTEIEGLITVWDDLTKIDVADQFADMMFQKIRDLKGQTQLLQGQTLHLDAVNSLLQRESSVWTGEQVMLEEQVNELTEELSHVESSDADMLGLRSSIIDLQSVNTGLEKKLSKTKSRYQGVCLIAL